MKINRKMMKKLIYFQIIFVLIYQFFVNELGMPSAVSYITDLINIILLFYIVLQRKILKIFYSIRGKSVIVSISILSLILLMGIVINWVPLQLVFWAIRNTYRFILFFIACVCILDKEDVDKIFNILCKFQILNFVLSMFQFLVQGKSQDYLGGIFGTTQGCNVWTNTYFCILLTYVLCKYLNKKCKLTMVIWITISTLVISACAELKIYFIEFALIVIFSIMLSKPSIKKFQVLFLSIIGAIIGLNIFKQVFPDAYDYLVNIDKLIEYNTTVIWGYNISRWGAFNEINDIFFKNNILNNLLGYGFGNCEYSSFDFLTSDFYRQYGAYNYRWFAHQIWFLECGYLGFMAFNAFFVVLIIWGFKVKKYFKKDFEMVTFIQVIGIMTIIGLWYNCAIRIEVAYLTFFSLSATLIYLKSIRKELKDVKINRKKIRVKFLCENKYDI